MEKLYWAKAEQEAYDKWKDTSPEELLLNVCEIAEYDGLIETTAIIELCKKKYGLKYVMPCAQTKKEMLESGCPENEFWEAKE